MEDGLGLVNEQTEEESVKVLILVLMEDGLGRHPSIVSGRHRVLILVLMEDGLGRHPPFTVHPSSGLNPCFNGRWSRT